ncbi:hypothetical protein DESC_780129 [Desulfosarcina cetonica]|nr:hypothetical protein DESC_780129 [Desulfosarcina cetonica]
MTAMHVYQENPQKPDNQTGALAHGERIILEPQVGEKGEEKRTGPVDDGGFHPGGVGKADIKQGVLQAGLQQAGEQYGAIVTRAGKPDRLPADPKTGQDHQAGQAKPVCRKKKLAAGAVLNRQQRKTEFDHGKSAAPEQRANQGKAKYGRRPGKQIFAIAHLVDSGADIPG